MRKELLGIFSVFVIVCIAISLLSFHIDDPSVFHPGRSGPVHNLFGLIGAHISGLLYGLFGKGVFWIPIALSLFSIQFFRSPPVSVFGQIFLGCAFLVLTTSSIMTIFDHSSIPTGHFYATPGGLAGVHISVFLLYYAGLPGTLIVLAVLGLIGILLSTGLTLKRMLMGSYQSILTGSHRFARPEKPDVAPTAPDPPTFSRKPARRRPKDPGPVPEIDAPPIRPAVVTETPTVSAPDPATVQTDETGFRLPGLEFLDDPDSQPIQEDNARLIAQSQLLENKLADFGVKGKVTAITPGPVITTFEYEPAPGIKINRVVNLSDDLALALKAMSIRIVAPIPGKAVIGIEIPNITRQTVHFKEIVSSGAFEKAKSCLTLCLGKDIVGNPVVAELERMPHLLIAGATGTGKSVGLNAMICSLLYKSMPDQVKLIMIDPKRIELTYYDGIPHLITPVVTDVKKATNALFWAVKEMERRYELLSETKCRNISQFNQKILKQKPDPEKPRPDRLPFIVIIIDELADLMMVASRDVEVALTRLAQMARASGIHLILATQRPSVDVLTGIIKANFPTRLTFQVSSRTDSRTIIDSNGAENLLGNGDMLLLPPGTAKLQRIHGAYISEDEVGRITEFLKLQKPPEYIEQVTEAHEDEPEEAEAEVHDERYDDAVALVTKTRQASISMVQRHLRIGYNRAARIIEMMEKEGVVGPSDGVKPREVLVRGYED